MSAPFAMPVCACACARVCWCPGAATIWVLGAFEYFYALHSGCTWIGSGYMDRLCVCG